jgi:uncharacterized protein (TIGR03000 family)
MNRLRDAFLLPALIASMLAVGGANAVHAQGHGGGAGHVAGGGHGYGGYGYRGYGGYGRGYGYGGYGRYGYGGWYGGWGWGFGLGLGLGYGYGYGYPYYPYYGYPYPYPAYAANGYPPPPANGQAPVGPGMPPVRNPDSEVVLSVRGPADAIVWINGEKTTQSGPRRDFVSSGLAPGRTYTFEIRAQWKGPDGKPIESTQRVPVQGGERRAIDFATPPHSLDLAPVVGP